MTVNNNNNNNSMNNMNNSFNKTKYYNSNINTPTNIKYVINPSVNNSHTTNNNTTTNKQIILAQKLAVGWRSLACYNQKGFQRSRGLETNWL